MVPKDSTSAARSRIEPPRKDSANRLVNRMVSKGGVRCEILADRAASTTSTVSNLGCSQEGPEYPAGASSPTAGAGGGSSPWASKDKCSSGTSPWEEGGEGDTTITSVGGCGEVLLRWQGRRCSSSSSPPSERAASTTSTVYSLRGSGADRGVLTRGSLGRRGFLPRRVVDLDGGGQEGATSPEALRSTKRGGN